MFFAFADGAAVVRLAARDQGRRGAAVGVADRGEIAVQRALLVDGGAHLPWAGLETPFHRHAHWLGSCRREMHAQAESSVRAPRRRGLAHAALSARAPR